jgi:hypothetical protein
MCSNVDLPAPFGPRRPVTPGPIVRLMSLTATTFPYQRETARSSTTGSRPSDGRGPLRGLGDRRHVSSRR